MSNPVEALAATTRVLAIYQEFADLRPEVWKFQNNLAKSHNNIAASLARLGRLNEAVASQRRALAIWQRSADDNPAVTALQNNVAFGLNNLGHLLSELGGREETLAAYGQAKVILEKVFDADPSYPHRGNLADSLEGIGWILHQMGRQAEARTVIDRAISIREERLKRAPASVLIAGFLAEVLLRSGQVRLSTGEAVGAAADWRRAIALYEGLPPRWHDFARKEACCHAMLSGVAGLAGSGLTASDAAIEAERAMEILRRNIAEGYRGPVLRTESALDPLRPRPDFQLLMMDAAFPAEPFVH